MITLESLLQKKLLVFLFFLLAAFFIFRKSTPALPIQEDHFFMRERAAAASDFDFFFRALSFNRTRVIAPGDYYLFRPAMTGLLALSDIVFRENRWAIGALSLVLHALACFVLFLLCSLYVDRWKAGVLSIVFLAQYAGIDMLLYRHISFYVLAEVFLGVGAFCLIRFEEKRKNVYLYGAFSTFLLSSFFHEVAILVLPFLALLLGTKSCLGRVKALAVFCGPVLTYFAVNLLDVLYYQPPSFFGPSDQGLAILSVENIFSAMSLAQGVFFRAFVAPFLHVLVEDGTGKLVLEWGESAGAWLPFIGLAAFFLLGGAFRFWVRQSPNLKEKAVPMLFLLYWLITLVAMVAGRILQRGLVYLQSSTYYCYLFSFLSLFLLAAFWASQAPKYSVRFRRGVLAVFCLWAVACVGFSYHAIQEMLEPNQVVREAVSQLIYQTGKVFDAHADRCWGGLIGGEAIQRAPTSIGESFDTVFFRRSCAIRRGEQPLYFIRKGQEFALVGLGNPSPRSVFSAKPTFFRRQGNHFFALEPGGKLDFKQNVLLSQQAFSPLHFRLTIENPTMGGILLAYENKENYTVLHYDESSFFEIEKRKGGQAEKFPVGEFAVGKQMQLDVLQYQGVMSFIVNGVTLFNVAAPSPWQGKIGFYDGSRPDNRQFFSGISLEERSNAPLFSSTMEIPVPQNSVWN